MVRQLIVLREENLQLGVSAHLVVVVHEVHCMAAAVGGTLVPVVTYVVEDIHLTYRHVVAVHAATH